MINTLDINEEDFYARNVADILEENELIIPEDKEEFIEYLNGC